ncbi:IS110 family transposase [Streptomyces sp. NPDC093982]|uniref:IS110 family transposase n=1 Tax=Streptomyces sp. NPDC093982 TaxID=3155077 RepID=UPI00342E0845
MAPFRPALGLADTIPGINRAVAEVIIAETGADMSRFASAKHLASWAGVCPGHHESAGRTKNIKVRPGNPYLKGALGLATFGAVRTKDAYLQARYKRGPPAAAPQGPGRRRTLDHYRDLAHAHRQHRLPRAGRHLLRPGATPNAPPAARSTRSTSSATPPPSTR